MITTADAPVDLAVSQAELRAALTNRLASRDERIRAELTGRGVTIEDAGVETRWKLT